MRSAPAGKKSGPVVTGSRVRAVPEEEEDWDREEPEQDLEQEQEEEREPSGRRGATRLLTIIQITVCAAVLVAAVALRAGNGALYRSMRDWYFTALNDSIVPDSQMESMKRTVLDLWSAISSPRAENDGQASSQNPQNGTGNNGAASENLQSGNNNNAASQGAQSGGTDNNGNAASENQQSAGNNNNAASTVSQGAQSSGNGNNAASGNQANPNAQSGASSPNGANAASGAKSS